MAMLSEQSFFSVLTPATLPSSGKGSKGSNNTANGKSSPMIKWLGIRINVSYEKYLTYIKINK